MADLAPVPERFRSEVVQVDQRRKACNDSSVRITGCRALLGQPESDCKRASANISGAQFRCIYPDDSVAFRLVRPTSRTCRCDWGRPMTGHVGAAIDRRARAHYRRDRSLDLEEFTCPQLGSDSLSLQRLCSRLKTRARNRTSAFGKSGLRTIINRGIRDAHETSCFKNRLHAYRLTALAGSNGAERPGCST